MNYHKPFNAIGKESLWSCRGSMIEPVPVEVVSSSSQCTIEGSGLCVTDVVWQSSILPSNFLFLSDVHKQLWIAGFFDGEGFIHLSTRGQIQVGIANSDLKALSFIKKTFGGGITTKKQKVNKKLYMWRVYGQKALKFLKSIFPYSIVKKEQIKYAIEYLEKGGDCEEYRCKINAWKSK